MSPRTPRGAVALLLALAALVAGPVATQGAGLKLNLPAHVTIETVALPGPNDPGRCVAHAFAEFPNIANAVGYQVTIIDNVFNFGGPRSGPPFPDDDFLALGVRWKVHRGFHWFALAGFGTGQGCDQAILALEGRFGIKGAKVSMSEKFEERWEEPFTECKAKGTEVIGPPVVLGKRGDRLLFIRRMGAISYYPEGKPEKTMNLLTNVFQYRPIIIRTPGIPGDPDSYGYIKISAESGESILVGPGMTVRVEAGKPLKILEHTPGLDFDDIPPHRLRDDKYEIRTNACPLGSGRG